MKRRNIDKLNRYIIRASAERCLDIKRSRLAFKGKVHGSEHYELLQIVGGELSCCPLFDDKTKEILNDCAALLDERTIANNLRLRELEELKEDELT